MSLHLMFKVLLFLALVACSCLPTLAQIPGRVELRLDAGLAFQEINGNLESGVSGSTGIEIPLSSSLALIFLANYTSYTLDVRRYVFELDDTTDRLASISLFDGSAATAAIGAEIKWRFATDAEQLVVPYVMGAFGWYDSWQSGIRVEPPLVEPFSDAVERGVPIYIGFGLGADLLLYPGSVLYLETKYLRGQSTAEELDLISVRGGMRLRL